MLRTEAEAYEFLERLRWGGPPAGCPHCDVPGRCRLLEPAGGRGRRTRTGAVTERRVWKCGSCRRQFSVLAGTILQGTRISLRTWAAVLAGFAVAGDTAQLAAVGCRHGASPAAARLMARRIEAAAAHSPGGAIEDLLRLSRDQARAVRLATPGRVRPRRQVGPSADIG